MAHLRCRACVDEDPPRERERILCGYCKNKSPDEQGCHWWDGHRTCQYGAMVICTECHDCGRVYETKCPDCGTTLTAEDDPPILGSDRFHYYCVDCAGVQVAGMPIRESVA